MKGVRPTGDARPTGGALPTDPSRREFVIRSAAAGGLILSLSLPALGDKRGARVVGGAQALNAWLRIGTDDSITVIVDRSEMGQGVYTALPMLLAEELEVDLRRIEVVAAPVGDAYVNQANGGQITGTSNSVQDAWVKLRTAGAQARLMLIAAAARGWGVDPAQCRAENGAVIGPGGKTSSYGRLADAAARMPVPKQVALKSAAQFRLIGKPTPRLDTPGKVDGSAQFGIDVQLPGMLYAVLAQSPVPRGKVAAVDAAAASAMPGVRRVLPVPGGVLVVAEHFWQALAARNALKIDWDPGANAHLDNAAIDAVLKQAAATNPGIWKRKDGDASAALKTAAQRLEAVYELPMLAHAPMEPMNCTADVTAGRCDLYVGTQSQQLAQAAAAEAAGLAPAQVNVVTTLLGGGFGRRLDVDFVPAAVLASKAVGRPVKLIWTREDDMTHCMFRPPAREELSAGLDGEGRLLAFKLHITSPSVTARFSPSTTDPFDSVTEYADHYPYAVPNFLLSFTRQEIGLDLGYMRSVSHAPNCFAIECFMDELAAAARKDPLQFRLGLLQAKPRHARVLNEVAQRAGWGRAQAGRFQGIALLEGYSTYLAQVAEISVERGELKVHRITCVVDCGRIVNPAIVESQIEGGIVFALSAALWGEITLQDGRVQQTNFNGYRLLRANEMPQIDVHLVPSAEEPGGIGEAGVPAVAPAICNAIHAATGKRLRSLPIAAQSLA